MVWQEVRDQKAIGDADGAWHLEQKLLEMVESHPNDLGVVPILRGIADERMDILSRFRAGKLPPQITLGCYYDKYPPRLPGDESPRNCLGGTRNNVMQSLLAQARTYYEKAISVLYRHQRYSSAELRKLEASVIRASYLDYTRTKHLWYASNGPDPRAGAAVDYRTGTQSYRRLISYGAATSAPWGARVETFVEMTDWDLLFSQRAGSTPLDNAVRAYERAYRLLEHKAVARASIDKIFSPKMPVVLPTFLPNPLLSKRTSHSSGHIDVAFYITKYERSRDIEILGTTTNAPRAKRKELVHLIGRCLFQPRISDGQVADTSRVVLRYYLNNQMSVGRACRYGRLIRPSSVGVTGGFFSVGKEP